MVFYKIEALRVTSGEGVKELSKEEQRTLALELAEQSNTLFQRWHWDRFIFAVVVRDGRVILGAVSNRQDEIEEMYAAYKKLLPFELEEERFMETTFRDFSAMLHSAERNLFIYDEYDILDRLSISNLNERYKDSSYGENILRGDMTVNDARNVADECLFNGTFLPELERIYTVSTCKMPQGHPVHYFVRSDDQDSRRAIYRTLLEALYQNGRIKNKRYCFVNYSDQDSELSSSFETLYRSAENGAVVIRYNCFDRKDGGGGGGGVIEELCAVATKYKHQVLTVICLPAHDHKAKEEFMTHWGCTSFVELTEDVVFGEQAERYLKRLAKKHKVRTDKNLIPLQDPQKGYMIKDLDRLFEEWYDKKLRNQLYPQYKDLTTVKNRLRIETPKGGAYEQLQKLIGLKEAKKVMDQAINFYKAQKLFADRGMVGERPAMHMVFTGNPGTAKTTVARLFAQIMKENGLLSKGDLYEVGRADLVGKYVGHTAPLVKQAFKKARGSVLFIDEAYSLVDDRNGLYGDEAINTIVQEMENHREDIVVIFAGYPDKMEGFLNKNPGLRSRIAYHIPFADYSAEELCEIAELVATNKGLNLTEEAMDKLNGIFAESARHSDFGNGRFVRNLIEKAKMAQANRLVAMDYEDITDRDIVTICAEDIEQPAPVKETKIRIGFSA